MTEIHELEALHCLIKCGDWGKAAVELGTTEQTLRSAVARLQARLGKELLQPDSTSPVLTEAGLALHSRTLRALEALAEVEASVQNKIAVPSGTVHISAPVVLGQAYVAPLLHLLRERYPKLAISLTLMDRFVDLVHENVDLALRIGAPYDSRLVGERLCANRRVLVASPSYLQARGTPNAPSDLSRHECILFTSSANPQEWQLQGPDGVVTVPVSGMVSTNNGNVLNSSAEQGIGITFGPTLSLAPLLLDGRVVRVLPDYSMAETGVYAVYAATASIPNKVRAVVDFFLDHFTDPPAWDRQLEGRVPGFSL
jgi:DNA-binding transcriptional LysR family regulator